MGLSECVQGRLFRSGFEEIEYERCGDRRLFSERLVVFPGNDIVMARSHEERTIAMKYTTGPPSAKFADPLIRLREEEVEGYPPSMRLRNALKAALIYMRHNIPQAVIGEQLDVSQPTVSRAIKALTEAASRTLAVLLLTAEEVPEGCDFRGGRHPLPLLRLAQPPRSVVGQAQARGHERPDPGPARRRIRVGLGPLSGVHTRRGGPGRLPNCSRESTPPDGSPTRTISEGE